MVAPLALIALLWDRRDWSASRLQSRTIAVPLGSTRRAVPLSVSAYVRWTQRREMRDLACLIEKPEQHDAVPG